MIIDEHALTHNKHNERKTKKKKNCHTSLRLNTLIMQYYFFDYTYGLSLNNAVLTTMQGIEIIVLNTTGTNGVDTNDECVYNIIHVVQQLMIMLLLIMEELFCNWFCFCDERT